MEKIAVKIKPRGETLRGSPMLPSIPLAERRAKTPEFSSRTKTERGFDIVTEKQGNSYFISFPQGSSGGQMLSIEIGQDSEIAREVNEEARRIAFHDFYSLDKLIGDLKQYILNRNPVTNNPPN